jgi:hypothetical protein
MTGDPMPSDAPPADDASAEEIERDIERTRADLGDTVDALSARLDPRIRTREAAERAKQAVRRQGQAAKSAAKTTASRLSTAATDEAGRPKPLTAGVAAAVAAALVVTAVTLRRRR